MTADIVVLRQKVHGQPPARYASTLRDRLPDHEVALAETPSEEQALLAEARVATGIHLGTEALADAPNLELFACAYAGTDHLPMRAFEERGVAVTAASGVHGPNIAEYVVGALIAQRRQFDRARRQQERGHWAAYPVGELAGSTATVVGLGAIGRTLVDRLHAFDVDTVGVRYTPEKGGQSDVVVGFDDLQDALARADQVVLACPLTETTEGLIDADALRAMRTDAILVNIARGPIVDTGALVEALRDDTVGGAVLDVTDPEPLPPDHPLWGFDDVLVTPHNAGNTPHYYDRLADIVAENVRRAEEKGAFDGLRNQVV